MKRSGHGTGGKHRTSSRTHRRHVRASRAQPIRGDAEEALSAQDFEMAAHLIQRIHATWTKEELAELQCWLQSLPEDVRRALPELNGLMLPNGRGPLTPRELEVLRLIGQGASNREIARSLVVSTGTVKKHLNNIFAKLQAQNRTQAAARARELGLL